jgi:hypothetical protein
MENDYSFPELADMHLVVTECNGNDTDAVRIYKEKDNVRASNRYIFFLLIIDPKLYSNYIHTVPELAEDPTSRGLLVAAVPSRPNWTPPSTIPI